MQQNIRSVRFKDLKAYLSVLLWKRNYIFGMLLKELGNFTNVRHETLQPKILGNRQASKSLTQTAKKTTRTRNEVLNVFFLLVTKFLSFLSFHLCNYCSKLKWCYSV